MTSANVKRSIKRKQAAKKIIHRRMLYAAGLGLIPIPIVDAAGILGIQILMIKDLSKVYGIPFKEHRVKSFIGSLAGSLGAMSAVKALPGLGSMVGAAAISTSGAASTYAIGKVFVHHFNLGGTLLNFDPVESQKYFHKLYEDGEKEAARLKSEQKGKMGTFIKKMMPTKEQAVAVPDTPMTAASIAKAEKKARELAKAKRRKIAKNKKIRRYALLLILVGLGAYYYLKTQMENSNLSTSIDLLMERTQAKQVDLQPSEDLDSLTKAEIARFSSNATESVIAKYIQEPEATYPKRFALSAVRFNGSSNALSSGAREQLSNIAFLMKKYPALIVNIYGHTSNLGPEFNRRRIGRERARLLHNVFVDLGIPSYKITGNYIEKSAAIHEEYWGAEIVIDVSTEENAVTITMPPLPSTKNLIPGFIKKITRKKEEEPEEILKEEPKEVLEEKPKISLDSPSIIIPIEEKIILEPIEDTLVTEVPEEVLVPPAIEKEEEKEEEKKVDDSTKRTESLIRQYIENKDSKYPKVFTLSHVWFSGESEKMDDKAKKQLAAIAQLLQEYTNFEVAIYGHTSDGSSQKTDLKKKGNLILKWQVGQGRAEAIQKELNDNGVSNQRMSANAIQHSKEPDDSYWGAEIVLIKT